MVNQRKVCSEERKPHFFKVFLPGFTDERVEIPWAFLKHIKDKQSGTVTLLGPSGNVWHVDLNDDVNGLYLQNGWKDFVRDHSLQVGYFLVFRYDGNLHFSVRIYDPSGCENEDSFYVESFQNSNGFEECKGRNKVRDTDAKVLNASSYKACKGTSKRTTVKHQPNQKRSLTYSKKLVTRSSCQVHSNSLSKNIPPAKKPVDSIETNINAEQKSRNIKYAICSRFGNVESQRRHVTDVGKARALKDAKAFKSKKPFTLIIMQMSHVYAGFLIRLPVQFYRTYLPKTNQTIILCDPSGREWKVKYIINKKAGCLSGGWGALSKGNNLEMDDVCVFECISKNKLQVHIFKVVKEITPLIKMPKCLEG
ncbi:B3 domain-containing protein Os11g0197600-like [Tasmannia lanceolata]|uniref:B3 domain-containing protein Os11g0197600-like n=1 Tax=Tasmannia lanceolata TaxID=3420 RepID=UPI0040645343